MATSTRRIVVTPAATWTALQAGPKNVLIKVAKDCPGVQILIQATATPDPTLDQYFFLEWDDIALRVTLATGESIYYRVESGHDATMFVVLQD